MSLQVWLPLNGSLENRGLEQNYKIEKKISANASSTELISKTQSGKITAKSYLWENEGQAISINGYMNKLKTYSTYSISAWVYYTQPSAHSLAICSSGNWNDSARKFNFVLYNYSNGGYTHVIVPSLAYWNSDCVALDTPIQPNQWYHICITCDTIHTKIYINGQLQSNYHTCAGNTITTDPENENLFIGGATYWYQMTIKGSINDLRIYDHCLSPREVKLLAQGLVAHYKLDGLKLTNLMPSTQNYYGEGVTSATIDTTIKKYNASIKVIGGSGGECYIRPNITINYISGHQYYARADIYQTQKHGSSDFYVILAEPCWYSGKSVSNVNSWTRISNILSQTKWNNQSTTIRLDYNNGGNTTIPMWFDGIMLIDLTEAFGAGNEPSVSWCDANIPYFIGTITLPNDQDCSGYNNHGTSSTQFRYSSDSKRYKTSSIFENNKYINCGRDAMVTDALTISCWAQANDWSTFGGQLISCTDTGGWGLGYGANKDGHGFEVFCNNDYHGINLNYNNLSSGWHHIAATYNGNTIIGYIDGQPIVSKSGLPGNLTYNSSNCIMIGAEPGGTTPSGYYFNGKLSDVRIYATALSAAAVKELYQSSISFLNNGTLQCSEIVEKDTNLKYNKNGIIQTVKIEEANTNLKLYNDKIQIFQIYEL